MKITEEMLRAWIEAELVAAETQSNETFAALVDAGMNESDAGIITDNEMQYTDKATKQARDAACEILGFDPNDDAITDMDIYDGNNVVGAAFEARHYFEGIQSGLDRLDDCGDVDETVEYLQDNYGIDAEGYIKQPERIRVDGEFAKSPKMQLDLLRAVIAHTDDDGEAGQLLLRLFSVDCAAFYVIEAIGEYTVSDTEPNAEDLKMLDQAKQILGLTSQQSWTEEGKFAGRRVAQIARAWAGGLPVIYGKLQAD